MNIYNNFIYNIRIFMKNDQNNTNCEIHNLYVNMFILRKTPTYIGFSKLTCGLNTHLR